MSTHHTRGSWDTHSGHISGLSNMTTLLEVVLGYEDSYNEILDNKNSFTLHSYNPVYIKTGPLRECITGHLVNESKKQLEVDKTKFSKTFLLLDKLKNLVDKNRNKVITRAYVTCLPANKQIYAHSDTDGYYWNTIDRYQFYYNGNNDVEQIINDTLFPVESGYLYYFDHKQIHSYHNNSSDDLILMVFDVSKNIIES